MSAFFLALGPAIKQNSKLPPFPNLEVHNLVMDLLQVKSADRAVNNVRSISIAFYPIQSDNSDRFCRAHLASGTIT